jgi:hypothetical protein
MESTSPISHWTELLRGLNARDVRYLIVGAHALGRYAIPRATGDLDIWIERSRQNAERTYRTLIEFGAPLNDLSVDDLQRDDLIFAFGRPPLRVDVLTDIDGVVFEEAWKDRAEGMLGGVSVSFIGRAHLIANKRAAGRAKDLADVEALEREQGR